MPGLPIRGDLSPEELRQRARREDDGRVSRRLLAIANALDGMSREMAARAAGMDRQTLREWVTRYNLGGVTALSDAWGNGRPCWLSEGQQAALRAIILADLIRPWMECRPGGWSICAVHTLNRTLELGHPISVRIA